MKLVKKRNITIKLNKYTTPEGERWARHKIGEILIFDDGQVKVKLPPFYGNDLLDTYEDRKKEKKLDVGL